MRYAFAAVVAMTVALGAQAAETTYRFHLAFAGGKFEMTKAEGTHWTFLKYGCSRTVPDCEVQLNDRGAFGAAPGTFSETSPIGPLQVGLRHVDGDVVALRCLTEACNVSVTTSGGKREKKLARGESMDVPSESDLAVNYAP